MKVRQHTYDDHSAVLTTGPDHPEEFLSDEDLFGDIVRSCTVTNQHNANSTICDTSAGPDPDSTEETHLDGVVLNEYPADEDSDDGDDGVPDEIIADTEAEDMVIEEGTVADEMDIDESAMVEKVDIDTGIENARSSRKTAPPPFRAGCAWTTRNWSCAYDTVFMVFFTIYQQSSFLWRGEWCQKSPGWTTLLADHFNLLLTTSNSSDVSPGQLSKLFSSFRDQFRRQLANHDPQRFPCSGQVATSICAILELLFGSVHGPGIEESLICTRCGETSQNSHHFPFLALSIFRRSYRHETDPRFIPSATLLARFIESLSAPSNSSLCFTCLHETTRVQYLRMPSSPWLWFEIDRNSTMAPSLTLPIEVPGQRLTYNLCAVIYNGENHFTARMRDPSNRWWSYDGMWRFGAARHDPIQVETDLLQNGRLHAAFFIYRCSDY
jgi:hypothetical protein